MSFEVVKPPPVTVPSIGQRSSSSAFSAFEIVCSPASVVLASNVIALHRPRLPRHAPKIPHIPPRIAIDANKADGSVSFVFESFRNLSSFCSHTCPRFSLSPSLPLAVSPCPSQVHRFNSVPFSWAAREIVAGRAVFGSAVGRSVGRSNVSFTSLITLFPARIVAARRARIPGAPM
jgi:hypothetical protein